MLDVPQHRHTERRHMIRVKNALAAGLALTLPNAAFLILAVMVIIRSNAEVDLAAELAATATLLFIGAVRKDDKPMPVRAPAPSAGAAASHGYRPPPRWRR